MGLKGVEGGFTGPPNGRGGNVAWGGGGGGGRGLITTGLKFLRLRTGRSLKSESLSLLE